MGIAVAVIVLALLPCLFVWGTSLAFARYAIWGSKPGSDAVWLVVLLLTASIAAAALLAWWVGASILAIAGAAILFALRERSRYVRAKQVVIEHAQQLATWRAELIIARSHDKVDTWRWQRQVSAFVDVVLRDCVGSISPYSLIEKQIRVDIEREAAAHPVTLEFTDRTTPLEYEKYVAWKMRSLGWDAHATKASGDKGADVLASKDGQRAVIQCKLYSKPVSVEAVREVIAGRDFHHASLAAVVSNAGFTATAIALAKVGSVHLLHHDALSTVIDMPIQFTHG